MCVEEGGQEKMSKAYCRVQGGWVGRKSDEFGRTYFLDAPIGLRVHVFVFIR